MIPYRKTGAPVQRRRFFLWEDRAAGESSVLPEPEEPDRAADPDTSVPDME